MARSISSASRAFASDCSGCGTPMSANTLPLPRLTLILRLMTSPPSQPRHRSLQRASAAAGSRRALLWGSRFRAGTSSLEDASSSESLQRLCAGVLLADLRQEEPVTELVLGLFGKSPQVLPAGSDPGERPHPRLPTPRAYHARSSMPTTSEGRAHIGHHGGAGELHVLTNPGAV